MITLQGITNTLYVCMFWEFGDFKLEFLKGHVSHTSLCGEDGHVA